MREDESRDRTNDAPARRRSYPRIEKVTSKGIHSAAEVRQFAFAALEDFGNGHLSTKGLRAAAAGVNAACNADANATELEGRRAA